MNAAHGQDRPSSVGSAARGAWRGSALLVLMSLATGVHGAQTEEEPVAAVWQERTISVPYSSTTGVYSCRAIAARVASILRAVGARDDVKVRASGCREDIVTAAAAGSRSNTGVSATLQPPAERYHDRNASYRHVVNTYVRLMMPVEVTPEVLAELKRDKSRRELVSRATGNPSARFNDPILFSAQRQHVTLSRETIGIEPEECELLEQLSTGVFRELGVRVVSRDYVCKANSQIPPKLVAEVLLPVEWKNSNSPQPPEDRKDGSEPSTPARAEDDAAEADAATTPPE